MKNTTMQASVSQVNEDLPQAMKILEDLKDQIEGVTSGVRNLIKRVDNQELSTAKGISFLEVKYQLLLSYLVNLTLVMQRKVGGLSIKNQPAIERLVEIRTVLERIRPIDQKLKYQIDKLIKTAVTGTVGENDPLRFEPNPRAMLSKFEDEEESESGSEHEAEASKPKVYRPPKISSMPYDGDETEQERQEVMLEKAKKKALSSSIMRELQDEYHEGPQEIKESRDLHKIKADKMAAERRDHEETYFVRMAVSKKEKQAGKKVATLSSLNDLTKFGDISALSADRDTLEEMGGKKRKRSSKTPTRVKKIKAKALKKKFKRS